jgi:hypothetical protein
MNPRSVWNFGRCACPALRDKDAQRPTIFDGTAHGAIDTDVVALYSI